MSVIVHLSDTHFGTEVTLVLQAVQEAMHEIKPDIITISGDITQRAHRSQFKQAAEFLESLPAALRFVIPGNHDIPLFNAPLRLLNPYANYSRMFGPREGMWFFENVGIVGYDATSRWRHTRGYIPDSALVHHIKRARARLKPDALLIACAHQPLVVALPEDQENILIHAERTARLLAEHHVDLVLSGHVHMPIVTTTKDAFPRLPRHFALSGAGTAVSCRVRSGAPNAFNVIRTHSEGQTPSIAITWMEYSQPMQRFIPKLEKSFSLTPAGWTA